MKLAPIVLFFSILLLPAISASSYNLEFNQVDNTVLVTHLISLDKTSQISIPLPSDAYSISSDKEYLIQDSSLNAESKSLKVSYLTKELLEKSEEGYYFVAKVPFQFDFESVNLNLILKEGYHIRESKIFPPASELTTDGEQISLIWKLSDVKSNSDTPLFVSIVSPQSGLSRWTIAIIILLILALIAYYVYKNFIETRIRRGKESSPIESHLMDSENSVISALKEADRGELWQKQLQLKTNFSKAKLSRVIRNLESRNLLEKIPYGNTNKVRLK